MMVTPRSAILRIMRQRIVDLGRVEPGIDLVQHQQARLHGEALGEFEALALRQRQRGGGLVRGVGEAGECRCSRACAWASVRLSRVAREQRAGGDVLQHRHLRERLHDLEGAREPEPRDLVGPHPGDVAAVEEHASGGRRMHAGDQIDQGGLAGAIRSDQAEDLAFLRPLELTSLTAFRPPKRRDTFLSSSSAVTTRLRGGTTCRGPATADRSAGTAPAR